MRILTVNCGSSSLKVDVFSIGTSPPARRIASATITGIHSHLTGTVRLGDRRIEVAGEDGVSGYREALNLALESLHEGARSEGLTVIGHRVVHGGLSLFRPVRIDGPVLQEIEEITELAPLHNRPALEAIRASRDVFGDSVQMVAVFDTGFFHDLPAVASIYAIPSELASSLGIRRFGFHGLAHRFMSARFAALSGRQDARVITLQLGSGCSATALRGLAPIDTSMGFTPLEGLVMATRSGDLDPALPGHIAQAAGMTPNEVEDLLNLESGMLGISGHSADVRQLLSEEARGNAAAALALELFCYRIRKYIGAYAAALGGLDGLVFGGGIGENSAEIRDRISSDFQWLGLSVDQEVNQAPANQERRISGSSSRVACYVIPVDEATVIAEDTLLCLTGVGKGG